MVAPNVSSQVPPMSLDYVGEAIANGEISLSDGVQNLVEREIYDHGVVGPVPCGRTLELLTLHQTRTGADFQPIWEEAVGTVNIGSWNNHGQDTEVLEETTAIEEHSEVELTEIQKMNDAELLGTDHPDMQALLEKPFTFMTGNLYGQRDHRNTQDGDWVRAEMPLLNWMLGQDKGRDSWGLTRHPVAKHKEGASIVLAEAIDGARKDGAIKTMSCIGLDIDSGAALDDMIAKLEKKGLFAIVYTSFSHGKSTMILKHDDIMRKLKLEESPNRTQIQMYLREHHKDRFDPEFIENIQIKELRQQTPDGLRTVLETPALDKFRVILPLWESVELSELGATVNQWKDAWADAVTGVAVNMLGVNFDATSCDVNRLFFTPRHPKDADDWYSAVVMGRPLRFEEIEPYSKNKYVKERDPGDPFASVGGDIDTNKRERFSTDNNFDLNKWHTQRKSRWQAVDVIESFCSDKIREAGGEKPGTCHLECPFEHEHSAEGGTATMAMNPDENDAGYWTIFCRHDACNGRDKLEFVKAMVDEGWFEESVLTDEEWSIPLPDEDDPDEEEAQETEKTAREQAAEFTVDSTDEEIKKFIKRQIRLKADDSTRANIIAAISGNTELTKKDVGRMWTAVMNELEQARRQRAEDDGEAHETVPVTNQWDFGDMVTWGENRIKDANAKRPRIFHHMRTLARIENGGRLVVLDERKFAAEFNNITKWHHVLTGGDVESRKEVAAPSEVVSHLFHSERTIFPELKGIITVPTFTRDGSLISTPGFHDNGLFYWNNGELDIPQVSKKPIKEEVGRAKELFLDALGEFPFDGLTPEEVAAGGSASYANMIGLILLPFMREMIDGATPSHLLNKPSPRTGSGLALDVCSIIWNGEFATTMTVPKRQEEIGKTIIAKLRSGASYFVFDNIPDNLDSDDLAMAISQGKIDARILGKNDASAVEPVKVRATWILDGNNVTMSEELMERTTLIALDAKVALPGKRTGWNHPNLRRWAKDNRGELVWACLTLIQNWIAKGRKPYVPPETKGGFEEWLACVGGVLQEAGIIGFYGNAAELREEVADNTEDAYEQLSSAFADHGPGKWFHVSGKEGNTVLDLLQKGPNGDGDSILIDDWGCEGSVYSNPQKLGRNFEKFAKKPHLGRRTTSKGTVVYVEIGFDQHYDTSRKVNKYMLKMRAPGAKGWIKSVPTGPDDPNWEAWQTICGRGDNDSASAG